jgi:hypothetical protein
MDFAEDYPPLPHNLTMSTDEESGQKLPPVQYVGHLTGPYPGR